LKITMGRSHHTSGRRKVPYKTGKAGVKVTFVQSPMLWKSYKYYIL